MSPDSQATGARTASRRSQEAQEEVRMPSPCQRRASWAPPWPLYSALDACCHIQVTVCC